MMSKELFRFNSHPVLMGCRGRLSIYGLLLGILACTPVLVGAQAPTFAGNPQHTSVYSAPAQNLNTIKWSTTIDFNNTTIAHYGSPLVTAGNTVLVPVKTATNGFRIDAFNGANGTSKFSINTDYLMPAHNWIPVYNPCVATGSFGTRMYYAGARGTNLALDKPPS